MCFTLSPTYTPKWEESPDIQGHFCGASTARGRVRYEHPGDPQPRDVVRPGPSLVCALILFSWVTFHVWVDHSLSITCERHPVTPTWGDISNRPL